MAFLSKRSEAELEADLERRLEKDQRKKLVSNLYSRRWIINNKTPLDLETAHRRLGYRGESVVRSQDVYRHALEILEGLIKLPPEEALPEIHALRRDLGDGLLHTRSELEEFAEGERACQNLQAALCRREDGELIWRNTGLEAVIETALLTQEQLLECVNKPLSTLDILGWTHFCPECRRIERRNDIGRGQRMDPPHDSFRFESELSPLALAQSWDVRRQLTKEGIDYCQVADGRLQLSPLPSDYKQLLLDNNETLRKTWLRMRDRQHGRSAGAAEE